MTDAINGPDAWSGACLLDHSIFEHMRDGVAVYRFQVDGSRKLLDCNPSFAAMAGRSKNELLALPNLAKVQDCDSTSVEDTHIQQCFNSGTPYINTFSWIRPDGQDNVIESQSLPVPSFRSRTRSQTSSCCSSTIGRGTGLRFPWMTLWRILTCRC